MKKKLEGELISIAHRVLKLKNKSDLDQLLKETQKLYQALSVLKFIEDNHVDAQPGTDGGNALALVEKQYSEEAARQPDKPEKAVAEGTKPAAEVSEKDIKNEPELQKEAERAPEPEAIEEAETAVEEENTDVPEVKMQFEKREEDIKAEETSAKAVFTNENESKPEEVEKAVDAEIKTIEPDATAAKDEEIYNFEFAFERKAAPEDEKPEPVTTPQPPKGEEEEKPRQEGIQKPSGLEDFHNYKEPEFIKKDEAEKAAPQESNDDDWRNWEPSKSPYGNKASEPAQEAPKPEAPKQPELQTDEPKSARSLNDSLGKAISLGLNDRIAFEKHLFSGSSEDLNRVVSQLNTIDNFKEAKRFINEFIKPDYNNWAGKEEYEERFMAMVEKKFD